MNQSRFVCSVCGVETPREPWAYLPLTQQVFCSPRCYRKHAEAEAKPPPEMLTEADEWLVFTEVERKPKTSVFSVASKCDGTVLGTIKWYPQWRHYCFFPTVELQTVHSDRCLLAISKFITEQNTRHGGGNVISRNI